MFWLKNLREWFVKNSNDLLHASLNKNKITYNISNIRNEWELKEGDGLKTRVFLSFILL